MGSPRPPFIRSAADDLKSVTRLIFVDFLFSMILWPLILVVSILLIPLTCVGRWLLLVCCLPCTCRAGPCTRCTCRMFASATECSWIGKMDIVAPYKELRDRSREVLQKRKMEWKAKGNAIVMEETAEPLMTPTEPLNPAKMITKNTHSLVFVVQQSLSITSLQDLIQQRLIALPAVGGNGKYFPRFTQCLVRIKGGSLVWVDDPTFSISWHVTECSESLLEQNDLEQFLQAKSREGLKYDRPLWHLYIINEYGPYKDKVLLWRFHGSMYDGITIAKVLTYALGDPRNHIYKAHNQHFHHKSHVIKFFFNGPVQFLRLLHKSRRRINDHTRTNTNGPHQFNWSEKTLNLAMLIKNKMLLNTPYNDVLLSMVVGAVHGQNPFDVEQEMPCTTAYMLPQKGSVLIPFNLWTNLDKRMTLPQGNHLLMLPCDISHAAEVVPRLWHTERCFSKLKKSGDTRTKLYFLNWLHLLPFTHRLCKYVNTRTHSGCTSLFTSFSGPNTIECVAGAEIRDIMFFTFPPDGVARSFNFISYAGTVKFSILSAEKLTSAAVDLLIANMASQLNQINKLVFHRYFPEGVNANACPYLQPQSSKFVTEFMTRLADLDAMSRGCFPRRDTSPNMSNQVPTPEMFPEVSEGAGGVATTLPNITNTEELLAKSDGSGVEANESNQISAEVAPLTSAEVVIKVNPTESTSKHSTAVNATQADNTMKVDNIKVPTMAGHSTISEHKSAQASTLKQPDNVAKRHTTVKIEISAALHNSNNDELANRRQHLADFEDERTENAVSNGNIDASPKNIDSQLHRP